MKKVLTVFIASVLILTSLAGCKDDKKTGKVDYEFNTTGYPVVTEPITMKMMGFTISTLSPWEENGFFKEMEKITNMKWNFAVSDLDSYFEKRNITFASKDLPDVFFRGAFNQSEELSYGKQGLLIPLEDLIVKYAPNLNKLLEKDEYLKKVITSPDGHIYALPSIGPKEGIGGLYYNEQWRKTLNIPEPTNIDEMHDMLLAFKNGDPNGNGIKDEVPLAFSNPNELKASLMQAFGLMPNNIMYDDNGKAFFTYATEQYKEAISTFKTWYEEGLIDKVMFQESPQLINAMGTNNPVILGSFYGAAPFLIVGEDRDGMYQSLIPLKSKDGKQIWQGSDGIATGTFAITKNCKYPEAAMRWVDYLYSVDGGVLAVYGKEGESYKVNADDTWEWIVPEGQDQTYIRGKWTIQPGGGAPMYSVSADEFHKSNDKIEQRINELRARVNPYAYVVPRVVLSSEEQKKENTINADINKYLGETFSKFIIGEMDINSQWDNYIATLKKMGMDDLVTMYQKNYDLKK